MVMTVVPAEANVAAEHCAVVGAIVQLNARLELVAPVIVPPASAMLITAEEAASGPPFVPLTVQVTGCAALTGFGAPTGVPMERSAAALTAVVNDALSFA